MSDQKRISRRTALFALSQAAILPAGVFAAIQARTNRNERLGEMPELRDQPLTIDPLHDFPQVVTDQQLIRTLERLRVRRTRQPAKINHVDHALRMWGHAVEFGDSEFMDGPEMLSVLVDDRELRKAWGDNVRPLMLQSATGVRVRTQEGSATSSHVDHTLATLTEIGLPLTFRVHTRSGPFQLINLVHRAIRAFSLNQPEYEWTALVLGMYSRGPVSFYSRDGQLVDFDRLAQRMMRESLGQGVCYGGHRLFTLTMLLRIDREHHLLFSESTRANIEHHLSQATTRLFETQHQTGYWDAAWPGYKLNVKKELWEQGARLVATGHALEWWAMLPDQKLMPPRETIVRAGQWLVREIEKLQDSNIKKNYTFLTHAGRALSLWRAEMPAQSWRRLSKTHEKNASAPDGRINSPTELNPPTPKQTSLWRDERGFLMSIEMLLLAVMIAIGSIVGLAVYRDAIVQELGDNAAGVASLTQSFQFDGVTQSGTFGTGVSAITYDATVPGSAYTDNTDFCETVLDVAGDPPMCISIDASSVENE